MGVDSQNKYAAPHVWNLVSKQIRQVFSDSESLIGDGTMLRHEKMAERAVLSSLALAFAHRFMEDEKFDPLVFLDNCSSNTELYPLSEMWDEVS